jgi:hypothetical protein
METIPRHLFLDAQDRAILGSDARARIDDPVQRIDLADQYGICIMACRGVWYVNMALTSMPYPYRIQT